MTMKQGKTLVQLAQEVTRIQEAKRDFMVPTDQLHAVVQTTDTGSERIAMELGAAATLPLNAWASGQLAQTTDIPKAYFDRVAVENPKLMADNVNHGLERIRMEAKRARKPSSHLIRTLDGNVRGVLSSRYRILDSHDLLEAVLPILAEKGMEVMSSEVTERRLFIKAVSPKLQAEVKKGDIVQYGLTISTSDVGAGRLNVEDFLYRLVCTNGMIGESLIRKNHAGRNQADNDAFEVYSDRTKDLSDAAFWAQVQDIVRASVQPERFAQRVAMLSDAASQQITNFDLPKVVELTMRATGLIGEVKKNSILAALATGNEGAGLTKWGLINSVTAAAKSDEFSYEEATEMERAAGQILTLSPSSWKHIAAA